MTSAELTVLASSIAALASLSTVVVTVLFNRRSDLDKWRREVERKLIVTLVEQSRQLQQQANEIIKGREARATHAEENKASNFRWVEGIDEKEVSALGALNTSLTTVVSELELVAGRKVIEAAQRLRDALKPFLDAVEGDANAASPGSRIANGLDTDRRRNELVESARYELGIERSSPRGARVTHALTSVPRAGKRLVRWWLS